MAPPVGVTRYSEQKHQWGGRGRIAQVDSNHTTDTSPLSHKSGTSAMQQAQGDHLPCACGPCPSHNLGYRQQRSLLVVQGEEAGCMLWYYFFLFDPSKTHAHPEMPSLDRSTGRSAAERQKARSSLDFSRRRLPATRVSHSATGPERSFQL